MVHSRLADNTTLEQLKELPFGIYKTGPSTILPQWTFFIRLGSDKIIRITSNNVSDNGVYYLENTGNWVRL